MNPNTACYARGEGTILRSKLIIWLALAVVFTTVQCISACTFEACGKAENVPPCHKHHDSRKPESCSHQAVLANAYSLPPAPVAPLPVLMMAGTVSLAGDFSFPENVEREDGVSPPGPVPIKTTVLRI
ncbi:MAG TPA: hypothetical protein VKR43_11465 [Bryobacteraceae bacterium]|nr:hypothetical protein [Bryobacteraceae bacterium]